MNFLKYFLLTFLFPIFVFSQVNVINPDVIEGIAYQKNYIKNSSFEKNASGVNTYNDSADSGRDANNFKDGTGGAGSVTCTRSTTAPIADKASLIFSKGASNLSGHGCSIDFSIPLESKGKTLKIEFSYLVNSGTFVAGSQSTNSDVLVYLYDVTNSKIVDSLSNNKLYSISSTLSDKFSATFQSDSSSSNYRLVFHTAATGTTAFSLKIDSVSVSNSVYVFGSPVTDVAAKTMTLTNAGNATVSARMSKVGDVAWFEGTITIGSSLPTGTIILNMPSGMTIDSSKSGGLAVGIASASNSGGTGSFTGSVRVDTASTLIFYGDSNASVWNATVPRTFATNDRIDFRFAVAITGWSSSTQMSDGFDARIIVGGLQSSGSTSVGSTTTKISLTTALDSSGGITDQTNSMFLINSAGYYVLTASTSHSQVGTLNSRLILSVYKNGSEVWSSHSTNGNVASNTVVFTTTTPPISAKGGDYFEMYFKNDSGSNASVTGKFYAQKLQGPQTISATETIVASYGVGSGQTLTAAAIIKGDTKVVDTHGAYNTATGVYTVPAAGLYRISHTFFSITATSAWNVQIRKNTSTLLTSTDTIPQYNGGTSIVNNRSMNAPLTPYIGYFNAGDTIDFYNSGAIATGNLYANAASNYFTIERIK